MKLHIVSTIIIVVKILQKSPSREFMLVGVSFLTFLNSTLVNYCKVQSALEMHLVSSVMIKNFFFATCCIPLHFYCCLLSRYLNIWKFHTLKGLPRFIT